MKDVQRHYSSGTYTFKSWLYQHISTKMVKLKDRECPLLVKEIDSHTPLVGVSIASTSSTKTKHPFIYDSCLWYSRGMKTYWHKETYRKMFTAALIIIAAQRK